MFKQFKEKSKQNRCYCYQGEENKEYFNKLLEQGAILVDVRSPQEFAEGHLEKAILLPEYEITKKANDVLPDLDRPIIVYCSSGHRSKKAQKLLQKLGYQKVYNLCQGLENYE